MKIRNIKGNLLITFIITVSLASLVFLFIQLVGARLLDSGSRVRETQAFFIADAGLNKGVWYVATSKSQTLQPTREVCGNGDYSIYFISLPTSNEVLIISTGEVSGVHRTVSDIVSYGGGMPPAFLYSVFCGSALTLSGNAHIVGSVFASGNVSVGHNCSAGTVYFPSTYGVSGSGSFTNGGVLNPAPTMPAFDNSSYQQLINTAAHIGSHSNVSISSTTYTIPTGGLYVNGDLTISGNTTIKGSGAIVASGKIVITGNKDTISVPSTVEFVAGASIEASNCILNATTSTFFASTNGVTLSGNKSTDLKVGSMITTGSLNFAGNATIEGLVFSEGTASVIAGNADVKGCLIANAFNSFAGNSAIFFTPTVTSANLPIGFTSGTVSREVGNWREY